MDKSKRKWVIYIRLIYAFFWLKLRHFLFPLLVLLLSTCETPQEIVKLETLEPVYSNISYTEAKLSGQIVEVGSKPISDHGILVSENYTPDQTNSEIKSLGSTTFKKIFYAQFQNLKENTGYYFRAYATVKNSIMYGDVKYFMTKDYILATLLTTPVSSITSSTAISGGTISGEGGPFVTSRGVCWNTTGTPTIIDSRTTDGTGSGSFISSITSLEPFTTYYVRSYAVNNKGISYGNTLTFRTLQIPGLTVTDIDGNVYKTITIGNQVWMAENLKTTKFRNGDAIPNISDKLTWSASKVGAYCFFNNDVNNSLTFGFLYNWYALRDSRNLAPSGWHTPSDAEWLTLINYLGGKSVAGGKLKESGKTHWVSNLSSTTNESGFSALPGGSRNSDGTFTGLGYVGDWYTNSEYYVDHAWGYFINGSGNDIGYGHSSKLDGLSVRCIKGEVPVIVKVPELSTSLVTMIKTVSAVSGGIITSDGGAFVSSCGVCWSSAPNPTIADSKTTDPIEGYSFKSTLDGLTPSTLYHLRSYATNSIGTAYGTDITFKTSDIVIPTVTTSTISEITSATSIGGGNVSYDGGSEVTERGICWSKNQNPTTTDSKIIEGSGTGPFMCSLTNLEPASTYYVRAFATNSIGTAYGSQVFFLTLKTLPQLFTKELMNISSTGCITGGTITSAGGGFILAKGICWGDIPSPTLIDNVINNGTGQSEFISSITTAIPGTTYYVRSFATNEVGTQYGDQKIFNTLKDLNYYSFESGMLPVGWGGQWSVTNVKSFTGSYCLASLHGVSSDATLTITLANAGQIKFYYYLDWSVASGFSVRTSIDFYIDTILTGSYPSSSGWNQGVFDVSAGTHTFKWHFNQAYTDGQGYLDYILLPK
jgi:uncharacterized protein (TIGR02145 family)